MGALGEVFGLNIFMGDRGYSYYQDVSITSVEANRDLAVETDALVVHFNDAADMPEEELGALRDSGLPEGFSIERRVRWPWIRRILPWRYPRAVDSLECGYLAHAILQVCGVAARLKEHARMELRRKDGTLLVREARADGYGLLWADSWVAPGVYVKPVPEVHPNAHRLADVVSRCARTTDTWDIDTFPMTAVVSDPGGSFFPKGVLVINKTAGKVIHVEAVRPDSRVCDSTLDSVIGVFETTNQLPAVIRVRREDLFAVLSPLRRSLKVRVRKVDSIPLADWAATSLSEYLNKKGR